MAVLLNDDPGLASAAAKRMSPPGVLRSNWQRENGTMTWNVSVPPGSEGEISFPNLGSVGFQRISEGGKGIAGQALLLVTSGAPSASHRGKSFA